MENEHRQSNYELLRLLAGMGVIVLHFNYLPFGEGALRNATGSTFFVLMIFEVVSICAVNVFILFSGYFGSESNSVNFGKLLGLLIQTVFFRVLFHLVDCYIRHKLVWSYFLLSFLPVNYYVVLYVVLMILAPYLNRFISTLSNKNLKSLVVVLFIVFSVYATSVDVLTEFTHIELQGLSSVGLYGSNRGYSIVNFVLVYIIGVCLKRNKTSEKFSAGRILLGLIISMIALYASKMYFDSSFNYSNPILIIECCMVFLLFGKIKLSSKVINNLAKASFTSFLINIDILKLVGDRFIVNKPTYFIVLVLVLETVAIYGLGYITMLFWNLITKPLFKRTINKIPVFKLK